MMQRRVVITGVGPVTSIGIGREMFWESLLKGRNGISPVSSFDTSGHKVHNGAEVKGFDPAAFITNLSPNRIGRTSQFAIAAARLALVDARASPAHFDPERAGVSIGTTSGEPQVIEAFDDDCVAGALTHAKTALNAAYPCHVIAANVGREFQITGPWTVIPTACAAGNFALAHACDLIRSGRVDWMLAGGADSFSRITYTGFGRLGAIAPEICQPFDRNRRGMIPGEGAGMLVLETLDGARQRDARIYAEVVGYGLSCDAHHMTGGHPEGLGAARAMEQALVEACVAPHEVSYISAHGSGTPTNDRLETLAVKRLFKEAAYRIPISSVKSMLGHTMGAASALEAVVCALAVSRDEIPPTMHLETPDPECDLDYVPNQARAHRVTVALNNAYGFGGNNSALAVRKVRV
jgi:3-oxoacyl-[acyl-carrier-protein] synthase II